MCDCRRDDDRIIAALARENVKLREQVEALEDSQRRRNDWLANRKREFGVGDNVSFDEVWAKCLAAYRSQQDEATVR